MKPVRHVCIDAHADTLLQRRTVVVAGSFRVKKASSTEGVIDEMRKELYASYWLCS